MQRWLKIDQVLVLLQVLRSCDYWGHLPDHCSTQGHLPLQDKSSGSCKTSCLAILRQKPADWTECKNPWSIWRWIWRSRGGCRICRQKRRSHGSWRGVTWVDCKRYQFLIRFVVLCNRRLRNEPGNCILIIVTKQDLAMPGDREQSWINMYYGIELGQTFQTESARLSARSFLSLWPWRRH